MSSPDKKGSTQDQDGIRRRHSDGVNVEHTSGRVENQPRPRTSVQSQDVESLASRPLHNTPGSSTRHRRSNRSLTDSPSNTRVRFSLDVARQDATPPNRVRFSSDAERILTQPATETLPGDLTEETSEKRSPGSIVRKRKPSLSVQTGTLAVEQAERGMASTRPLSAREEHNTYPTSTNTGASELASASPARTRSRGYSLRRLLFNRNIGALDGRPGTPIELSASNTVSRDLSQSSSADERASRADSGTSTAYPLKRRHPAGTNGLANSNSKRQKRKVAFFHGKSYLMTTIKRTFLIRELKRIFVLAGNFILRISEIPPSKDGRHIPLDACKERNEYVDERTGNGYIGNSIRSTRYTPWNFLPRQLVAQFSKLANSYFLSISILQMIPGLSTTGTYTTIAPLMFFVALSMAKEGIDDLRRHKLDKEENNRETEVLRVGRSNSATDAPFDSIMKKAKGVVCWTSIKWRDVQVGDIVRLKRDEPVPADVVLLDSVCANGIAFIETMALDGETSLKAKQSVPILHGSGMNVEDLAKCKAHIVVEDPNLDLYNFEGRVTANGNTCPLTNMEIIYRGSILRNTPEASAIVVYTGEECKIRMNANKNPRIKAPTLQKLVNRVVIFIVGIVVFLAIFCTVAHQIWVHTKGNETDYLFGARVSLFPLFTSFVIMLNTMIPLSLYVSLEIIKVSQMFLLKDVDMYDESTNTPFEPRTSTINEELGQVSYIFSDKTGTLTDNSMKFRKVSFAGTAWLHDVDLLENSKKRSVLRNERKEGRASKRAKTVQSSAFPTKTENKRRLSENVFEVASAVEAAEPSSPWISSARPGKYQHELRTMEMIRYVRRRPHTLFAQKARIFLLSLALCHTCLPESKEDGSINFQASSPDELAIIRAAQELGLIMTDRQSGTISIKSYPNGEYAEPVVDVYEVLDVIEFSSARKRMSVVVRFPDKRICLFCKGADSTVMQRLRLASLAQDKIKEIERRVSKRKSLEVEQVLRRKSEQLERRSSVGRQPSFNLPRPSMSGMRKSSVGGHLNLIRDEVDEWLKDRERDVEVTSTDDSIYYTPRPSHQLSRNPSIATYDARSSVHSGDEECLVEESLVADENAVFDRCFQHVNDFATEGLRTLMYGYRFMDISEYSRWKSIYQNATTSLVDRKDLIEKAAELVEHDLELAGATAIEDKLQTGVPAAIDKLRRANIKMWMLTGDKRETAINIGYSCRLIKDYSSVTILDYAAGDVEGSITSAIDDLVDGHVAHSVVVVDGQTLAAIYGEKDLHSHFFDLAILTDSVICCRASPSQKAGLVEAVRKKVSGSVTLAVGDGANDVAMIQEAHVGIGIMGKEGSQAARSSDYSIGQFRFLLKLLLVHGRWNYIRTCKYTVGTFWKEVLFYLTQCIYQRWNGYTGTSLYENWSLSMFNTLFTSLPVLCIGIFEKDLAASTLLAVPELYTKGQRNGAFNFKIYFGWMIMAAMQSVGVFYIMYGLYGQATLQWDKSLFAMGQLAYSACVILITSKLLFIEQHNKTVLALGSAIVSIGGWFLWNIVFSEVYGHHAIYHVRDAFLTRFGTSIVWWGTLCIIVVSCTIFEVVVVTVRVMLWPTDEDVFRELEKDSGVKRRFEEAAVMELEQGWTVDRSKRYKWFDWMGSCWRGAKDTEDEREGQVRDLLRNRAVDGAGSEGNGGTRGTAQGVDRKGKLTLSASDRGDEAGPSGNKSHGYNDNNDNETNDPQRRESLEIQEMLSKRFGNVQ